MFLTVEEDGSVCSSLTSKSILSLETIGEEGILKHILEKQFVRLTWFIFNKSSNANRLCQGLESVTSEAAG